MRYVAIARPRADLDYWEPPPAPVHVIVEDTHPRDTGLLDHHGVRIFAVADQHPVGFTATPSRPGHEGQHAQQHGGGQAGERQDQRSQRAGHARGPG